MWFFVINEKVRAKINVVLGGLVKHTCERVMVEDLGFPVEEGFGEGFGFRTEQEQRKDLKMG
jgi:hypothetical protein